MVQFNRKKMCDECPFRANAMKGWLGPHNIEHFEQLMRDDCDFVCHTEVTELLEQGMEEYEIAVDGNHCAGMLRYTRSMCRLSRDPEKAQASMDIEDIEDQPTIKPGQFRQHHTI